MKISARQLRQIIREELSRNLREEDETSAAAVKMPQNDSDPYAARRAYREYTKQTGSNSTNPSGKEKKLRDAAILEAWNEGWNASSEGERAVFVGLVKGDPNIASIAGDAILRGDFSDQRFADLIDLIYPEGAGLFAKVAGKDMLSGLDSKIGKFRFENGGYEFENRVRDMKSWGYEDSGKTALGSFIIMYPRLMAVMEKATGQSLGYGDKPQLKQGALSDLLFHAGKITGRKVTEP